MTYIILCALFIVGTGAAIAQTVVYSNQSSGNVNQPGQPVWVDMINKSDGNYLEMKNLRMYEVNRGTVTETIRIRNEPDYKNVFDFENNLMYHRGGGNGSSSIIPFTTLPSQRIDRIREYGCYMVRNGRDLDLVDFKRSFCM